MTRGELAQRIYEISNLSGQFTLRSGAVANRYFDKFRFEADPVLLKEIARAMVPLVPAGVEVLGGLEMGGIPLVTALSFETGIPALFVRKAPKAHGTCKLAEGGDVEGKRLLVVEDVVTSGGQILMSTADLRALGAEIETAVSVIDRESGGREKLAEAGIALRELYRMSELERAAVATLLMHVRGVPLTPPEDPPESMSPHNSTAIAHQLVSAAVRCVRFRPRTAGHPPVARGFVRGVSRRV